MPSEEHSGEVSHLPSERLGMFRILRLGQCSCGFAAIYIAHLGRGSLKDLQSYVWSESTILLMDRLYLAFLVFAVVVTTALTVVSLYDPLYFERRWNDGAE